MKKQSKILYLITLVACFVFFLFSSELSDFDSSAVPENSSFEVYYIDVGQADSTLIICDGETMLIDGGNAGDSDLIYTFLKNKGISHLDYVVCTHAHEDHVGGLSGALHAATASQVYSPVTEYDSKAFRNFVKTVDEQGLSITLPVAGTVFSLGSAEISILGPIKEYSETNNTSIVIKATHGDMSFLFTGDMERVAEMDLIESGIDLNADVLKVGHHGSSTSSSYAFIYEVMPKYGIISCGKNNPYGHPHDEVLSRFRDSETKLYRTDLQGTIICRSDGKTLEFTVERNAEIKTNPTSEK